ncbi:MAG: lytic transglycosylase domain-containing protein [Paracoccaceae bacterium]
MNNDRFFHIDLIFALGVFMCSAVLSIGNTADSHASSASSSVGEIKRLVFRIAGDIGVPESLALALAHAESNFDPDAKSHKGARGVMQIMPATALGEYNISAKQLWDPSINIAIGLHYLRRLINRYNGRTDLALSFYNGGSAVDRLGRHRPRVIPYTRTYVQKVLTLQRRYQKRIQSGVWQ